MKIYIKYLILCVTCILWYFGFSPKVSNYIFKKGIIEDEYRYGDLYRFSNLKDFRVLVEKCTEVPKNKKLPNTHLYLLGDSFTEPGRISSSNFIAANFSYANINASKEFDLDTTKKNILIIETVERHLRERFSSPWTQEPTDLKKINTWKNTLNSSLKKTLPYSTELHSAVLFSSDFILSIKEIKATINQKLFGRIDKNVRLSNDKKHLLYAMDTENGIHSIFDPISESQINQLVYNINASYEHLKSQGYDEVYLSIIPNKSTLFIQNEGSYNHLIERLESSSQLKIKVISTYTEFTKNGEYLYDKGDTHWNCKGKEIWTQKVNNNLLNFQ